jgi:hypothetical protein
MFDQRIKERKRIEVSNFRLFVEELKLHHPGYATVSVIDRERVKGVNLLVLMIAFYFKQNIIYRSCDQRLYHVLKN